MSDFKGAALIVDRLPKAKALIGDKGYDADWLRAALAARGIAPCIPSRANRNEPVAYDRGLYKARHKIEIMFGRLKDWRLAANPHPLRPLRPRLPVRHRHRRYRRLLALINES
jgi:transposase